MRCDAAREKIQDWLDLPGTPAMSDEIRDHIRDCGACRSFIKQWNSIEVGLQSLREQTPALSPGFDRALRSRLQGQTARSRPPRPFRSLPPWQFAVVGGSTALLLALVLQFVTGGRVAPLFTRFARAIHSTSRPEAPYRGGESTAPTLPTDLPLANTH